MKKCLVKSVCLFVVLCGMLIFSAGCQEAEIRHITDEINTVQSQVASVAQAVGEATYDNNETLNLLRALQAGNTASSPWNPYALPIGAGLSGVIALLEALRRNEKGKRKWAEHELNNNNKGKNIAG